ncbi:unnamed protein product [Euphydryas editha]|uniref:Peptidase S1 domain-containing protein n=1 Tax=Euphydryas editha TaxID=104508 RepID=A0AAU9ULA9_EUPED|nr:unnamed protein product [Euphydryas editha]
MKSGSSRRRISACLPSQGEGLVEEVNASVVASVGRMLDARFAGIETRFLPEKTIRPPLAPNKRRKVAKKTPVPAKSRSTSGVLSSKKRQAQTADGGEWTTVDNKKTKRRKAKAQLYAATASTAPAPKGRNPWVKKKKKVRKTRLAASRVATVLVILEEMKKLLHMFIALTINVLVNADNDSGWTFIGNPVLAAHPCNGSTDISVSFEPGLPPEEENSYSVYINKKFPSYSIIKMKFDAETSVTLFDKSFARIYADTSESNSFEIRFFKASDSISFTVKGLVLGTVPYFKSLKINNKEYCQKPNTGFLDSFISGYKDHAETPINAPATNCGRRKIDYTELIVGGAPTKPGDFPWHAALYKLDRSVIKYICGGTLISKNAVLTAAHCASSRGVAFLPEVLSVVLGKFHLTGGDVAIQEREVHQIILHDHFDNRHLDNDIALLKLKTEAIFTDYVQPACLWYDKANEKLPTKQILGTVVGWGFDNTDSLSPQLNQATIPIVSESTCIKSKPLFYATILTNKKFCAGYRNGTSACNGDSGGAFQVFVPDKAKDTSKTNGAWFVRGIVSLTVARTDVPICDPEHYVVFTDVAKYLHWIESNM